MYVCSFYTVCAFPYSRLLKAASTHYLGGQDSSVYYPCLVLVTREKRSPVATFTPQCLLLSVHMSVRLFVCLYAQLRSTLSDLMKENESHKGVVAADL